MTVLVIVLAVGLAAVTYFGLERLGQKAWVPLGFRAVAWAALGLLLINLSCPVRGAAIRPLVLLDASLSLGAAGGRWRQARDSAGRWGEVRTFGDERLMSDTSPTRGRSLLAPALIAASGTDRAIILVSDGEVEDLRDIPPDILVRSEVRLFPREQRPDRAITQVKGPTRVSAGDSIPLDVTIQAVGGSANDSVRVEVLAGSTRLGGRILRLGGRSEGHTRIVVPPAALRPGDHLLRVSLAGNRDAEPRTDTRLHFVTVARTPGVVLLAGPADWDSRFLHQALRQVSQLPVRGYVRIDGDRWRSMADLRPVPTEQVRRAARRADLLILKGKVANFANGSHARGIWSWPSGEAGETPIPGDWYLSLTDASPLSSAFLGQPLDSFPPAIQLIPTEARPPDWVALYAQLGRRGSQRPAVLGRQEAGIRRMKVAADGLWRWAFRGGASEQSYRSWVAASVSWLLGVDSTRGVVRPVQPVVPNGRPMVFEWSGSGSPVPQTVTWSRVAGTGSASAEGQQPDTLHFDGEGRATAWLSPGEYRYRLGSGASGTVAVEQYSDELLPRAVSLTPHPGRAQRPVSRTSARDWLWLFGLCVLALSGEWLARRRLGLR